MLAIGGLMLALLGDFVGAGPRHWLPADPHVLDVVSRCDVHRERCLRQRRRSEVLAVLRETRRNATQIAVQR